MDCTRGPYIKDVRTRRGEGVAQKQTYRPRGKFVHLCLSEVALSGVHELSSGTVLREVAWIYSYRSIKNSDKGGGGQKNPKILRTFFTYVPSPVAFYSSVARGSGVR